MSERIAAMTPIEKAAWGLVFALDATACDARNDAPWKALRDVHRQWIDRSCAELGEALHDKFGSFTDDEIDELFGIAP